ncbi:MAG: nucleotidyltransferase substrate binding protein [Bacteroidota bacterium]
MSEDVRWKQRFRNLESAFDLLDEALRKNELSLLEKAGVVQFFEFTFELSWKTLKDYLNSRQVEVAFPRDVIKEAFAYGLIENGDVWIDMLEKRNLLSHTYNRENSDLAYELISGHYHAEIKNLIAFFREKNDE